MFSIDEVKKQVAESLQGDITIPDGHRAAIVTFANTDKIEIAYAERINDHWAVEIKANHNWTGGSEIGAISKITW